MIDIGHNGSLNLIDGAKVLQKDPKSWGNLVNKAEYLAQFGSIKAWEIYILPHQLRPTALEQLADVFKQLSKHSLFGELDWLSVHFPTNPQPHHLTGSIDQEQWRPFYQLLQVLDRFTGAKERTLNFHCLAQRTIAQAWKLEKEHQLPSDIQSEQNRAKNLIEHALWLRDQLNPHLNLTVENNPPYDQKNHAFHEVGLFPKELKEWQTLGIDFCLDIQHAALVSWYRKRYGNDGPIPPMNELKQHSNESGFTDLGPRYIHAAGAPNSEESFHLGSTIGAPEDDIDWPSWVSQLKQQSQNQKHQNLPVIIELETGHLTENWPACQASATYLEKLLTRR